MTEMTTDSDQKRYFGEIIIKAVVLRNLNPIEYKRHLDSDPSDAMGKQYGLTQELSSKFRNTLILHYKTSRLEELVGKDFYSKHKPEVDGVITDYFAKSRENQKVQFPLCYAASDIIARISKSTNSIEELARRTQELAARATRNFENARRPGQNGP